MTIGIDLGTTFSVIATREADGHPVAIHNAEGALTTPSAVHANADGSLIVGAPALAYVDDTALAFKRLMGRDVTITLAGRAFTPVELSAAVLRKLATDAAAVLGTPVTEAIITVPANFGDVERRATRDAARLAGIRPLLLMNEPTAAATVYLSETTLRSGSVLVFDLGGGTLDITLLDLTPGGAYVKATRGVSDIGGQDFNNELCKSLIARYSAQYDSEPEGDDLLTLNHRVEVAKIALTAQATTTITIVASGRPDMTVTLTRAEFEKIIDPYIFRMRLMTLNLLHRASCAPASLQQVLLVGGSSRVPRVRAMLRDIFGKEPDDTLNADFAVAWGAALGASDEIAVIGTVNHDIRVRARQQGVAEPTLEVVLAQGHQLGEWSRERFFYPTSPDATEITVRVYQSDTPDVAAGQDLGEIAQELPAGMPNMTVRVGVAMRLDVNSLLEVRVSVNGGEPQVVQLRV